MKDILRKLHIAYFLLRSRFCKKQLNVAGKILIVAPHPDDEVIGCGGLISRLVAQGNLPHVIIMTGGGASHHNCCDTTENDIIAARRTLTSDALSILGISEENIHELDYPDGGISIDCPQTERLSALIDKIRPDSVFVPHWGEGWSDHVTTAKIVKAIAPDSVSIFEYCVWVWYYNVWRHLDWKNAMTLKMTACEHELKLKAIAAYTEPLAPCGRPWSGALPQLFLKANSAMTELYFKVK